MRYHRGRLTVSQEWRLQAACRASVDSRAFGNADEQDAFINSFCRGCPVKRECFEFGLRSYSEGVYGGTTARQRRALLKTRVRPVVRPQPCGTNSGYARHLRNGEKPCDPCKTAKSDYAREYYRSKRRAAA